MGFLFEGYAGFTNINGGLVDGCQYCVYVADGADAMSITFTGVNFAALVSGRNGSARDDYATIESNAVRIGKPTAASEFVFTGCDVGGANGALVGQHGRYESGQSLDFRWELETPGLVRAYLHDAGHGGRYGTFTPSTTSNNGDVITGGTSGATAVVRKYASGALYLDSVTGTFTPTETITGSLSGATATVTSIAIGSYYHAVLYNDDQSGSLSVQGVRFDLTSYLWAAGMGVRRTGVIDVQGNTFALLLC